MRFLFLLIIALVSVNLFAAQESLVLSAPKLHFKKVFNEDPLRERAGYYSSQFDGHGNIWIASTKGLIKYDGNSLKYSEEYSNLAQTNAAGAVEIINNNFLFVGYSRGLVSLDLKTGHWTSLKHVSGNNKTLPTANRVTALHAGPMENDLIIGQIGSLSRFNNATQLVSPLKGDSSQTSELIYLSMYEDEDGTVWSGTYTDGLHKYIPGSGQVEKFGNTRSNSSDKKLGIKAIVASPWHSDELLFGSAEGLHVVNRSNGQFTRASFATKLSQPINSLALDGQGGVWVGSDTLYHIRKDGLLIEYDLLKDFGITSKGRVDDILVDGQGTVFVFFNNVGLFKASPDTSKVMILNDFLESSTKITTLWNGDKNSIWVANSKSLFKGDVDRSGVFRSRVIKTDEGLPLEGIRRVHQGRGGYAWAVARYSVYKISADLEVEHFDLSGGRKDGSGIQELVEDDLGNLWILFFNEGMSIFNPSKRVLEKAPFLDSIPFASHPKVDLNISPDRKSIFYGMVKEIGFIDTHSGKPIVELNLAAKVSRDKLIDKNLPNYLWNAFSGDANNTIYMAYGGGFTNTFSWQCLCFELLEFPFKEGIIAVSTLDGNKFHMVNMKKQMVFWDRLNNTYQTLEQKDGIAQSGLTLLRAAMVEPAVSIFGTDEGLSYISARDLHQSNIDSNTYISEVVVSGVVQGRNDALLVLTTLQHHQNDVTLFFGSSVTSDQTNTKYRYRLVGRKDEWNETDSKDTKATYTNLDPGSYLFEVQSTNIEGRWGPLTSIELSIAPAIWNTTIARALYFLLLCFALRSFVRYRRRADIKRVAEAEELVEERTKQLLIATAELEGTNQELAMTNERDRHFVINLAHALRTPLSILSGILTKLSATRRAEELSLVKLADTTIVDLLRKIDLLLTRAKFEGKHEIEERVIDFSFMLDQICTSFEPLIESRSQSITVSIENNLGVKGDVYALGEIIANLLSNAVKYNSVNGEIHVLLERHSKLLHFSVEDTGRGISEKGIDKITKQWGQEMRENAADNTHSSGLGLAVVKEVVKSCGGELAIKRELNKGSIFTVKLPYAVVDKASLKDRVPSNFISREISHTESSFANEELARLVYRKPENINKDDNHIVLIVEDTPVLAAQLKDGLSDYYTVIVAENGIPALDLMRKYHPGVVVSDIMMPEMDGFELLKAVRDDEELSYIPVVLLTANNEESNRLKGLGLFANDFISKPVSFEELNLRIRNQFEQVDQFRKRVASAPILESSVESESTKVNQEHVIQANNWRSITHAWIEKNLADETRVEELALEFGSEMRRDTFSRKFKRMLGESPSEFIMKYKLQRSLELLKSGMPITQVAVDCGFSSPSHFSNNFKKFFDKTPSQYVKENK